MFVPREESFTSHLRSPAVAARIGVWLGICFGLAILTGTISHFAQARVWWFPYPTSPSWGYRLTQGVHVISGTAAVPLLLVKLWTVFPKLFARVPRSFRPLAVDVVEKASILVLVSAAVFQLTTGLANSAQWYPWSFSFRSTHFAVGWVAIGALIVHIAVKLPIIRTALGSDIEDSSQDRESTEAVSSGLSRRGLLRTTWIATGVAVLATAGATIPVLRKVSVFGVRDGDGPQGLPINKSAEGAGVTNSAMDPAFTLSIVHAGTTRTLTRADLQALPQRTASLPIACVEGWSASGTWTGVPVRDLLDMVDAPPGSEVTVTSLQERGAFKRTLLQGNFSDHPDTLLALQLNGEELSIDHGYPCRLIAPNRPGVLQTKWVHMLEVTA